jgi:ketosteroid isomerase-like protein
MRILLLALAALILTACGGEAATCDKSEPFQASRQGEPLAVPEDLSRPSPTGKFEIPEAGSDRPVRGPCGDFPPLRVAEVAPPAKKPSAPVNDADLPAPPTNAVPGADGDTPTAVAGAADGPPPVTGSLQQDIRATLLAWLNAQRKADGALVVSFYSNDFELPVEGQTREVWATQRMAAVQEGGAIDIRADRLAIAESFAGASARFIQEIYNGGQIDAVIKRLDFVVEDGRWLIVRETVLEVL